MSGMKENGLGLFTGLGKIFAGLAFSGGKTPDYTIGYLYDVAKDPEHTPPMYKDRTKKYYEDYGFYLSSRKHHRDYYDQINGVISRMLEPIDVGFYYDRDKHGEIDFENYDANPYSGTFITFNLRPVIDRRWNFNIYDRGKSDEQGPLYDKRIIEIGREILSGLYCVEKRSFYLDKHSSGVILGSIEKILTGKRCDYKFPKYNWAAVALNDTTIKFPPHRFKLAGLPDKTESHNKFETVRYSDRSLISSDDLYLFDRENCLAGILYSDFLNGLYGEIQSIYDLAESHKIKLLDTYQYFDDEWFNFKKVEKACFDFSPYHEWAEKQIILKEIPRTEEDYKRKARKEQESTYIFP